MNQEEADNSLYPTVVSVKVLVAQDISPATHAHAQVVIGPFSEVNPSSSEQQPHSLPTRMSLIVLLPGSSSTSRFSSQSPQRKSILIWIDDLRKTK